jgi:hypothetical protein
MDEIRALRIMTIVTTLRRVQPERKGMAGAGKTHQQQNKNTTLQCFTEGDMH